MVGMQLCVRRKSVLPGGLHSPSGKTVRRELQSQRPVTCSVTSVEVAVESPNPDNSRCLSRSRISTDN